jgi:lysophospholipase L1-like esterase
MKAMNKSGVLSIFLLFIFAACDPVIEVNNSFHSGTADFSRYIAIGNSLTAGYADQGLYPEAQAAAFPNLLAQQMKLANGGEFKQPTMPGNGSGYTHVINTPDGPSLGYRTASPNAFDKVQGPFNNLGIPGIRVKDVTMPGYGLENRFFGRILPSGQNMKTYLELVTESSPTFFTLWLGSNDVLGYAVSGGVAGLEGEPVTGLNGITPLNEFAQNYSAVMNALGEAQGLVITVPDVTLAPLFNTIPNNLIPITTGLMADQLNQAYASYNQGVDAYNAVPENQPKLRRIEFRTGANFPVVEDTSIPDASGLPKISQLNEKGLLLLTLPINRVFSEGLGTLTPIPDEYSLTETEVENIKTFTNAYNQIVRGYNSSKIKVFESTSLLQKVALGMIINGAPISSEYLTGSAFSLDGVHLTQRGNAMLANELIEFINLQFKSNLPPLLVTSYPGVIFPE